jgi:hypothetical protein
MVWKVEKNGMMYGEAVKPNRQQRVQRVEGN